MSLSQKQKNNYKCEKSKALRHLWLFAFVMVFTLAASGSGYRAEAAAGINKQINFQGKVVNSNGTNVSNGSYTFVFKLYTVSSGGAAVWTDTETLTVTDGIFQYNLGSDTGNAPLPGSVDFNSDNIYLGIEFNSDGEMSPRVHFTAAPYAFMAEKVNGLTVTQTNGTLTIANGETISFGGSFSTSGSNDVAFTTSGATTLTLPTTGTLATLAGTEILTNKTIGSTGLTFSGATTDITTASGEDLTLVAAGAGVIGLNDAVTVSGALAANGGITFDAATDTVGAFTSAGTIDMSTNILTNIGNSGTDFIASTGALTLAGILTANGGITSPTTVTLSGSAANIALGSNYLSGDGGDEGVFVDSTGAVGVNTGTPNPLGYSTPTNGVLTVSGDISTNSLGVMQIQGRNGGAGVIGNLSFLSSNGSSSALISYIAGIRDASYDQGGLAFYTKVSSTTEKMRLTSDGRLGIGDTSPDARLDFDFSSTDSTAGTEYGSYFTISDTGAVSTGTDTTYGNRIDLTRTGPSGGTIDNYGQYISLTGDAGGASTNYGLYVTVASADTNYTGIFMGGNFGIGDSSPASLFTVGNGDLFEIDTNGAITDVRGITNTGTISSTGAIAANGGITFDAATDTVGAHTMSGTVDANTNILTNIGNSGTDFVASTGALTLAGVLTANGGISLSGSQSLTAAALSYLDLGAIVHNTTANQGLRLPNAASASPSSPTSGEGYLAWDAGGNQLIVYNGSSWGTVGGGGMSIGGSITSATQGSILFAGASGVLAQDNANFFWDDSNDRLGIGDITPDAKLDIDSTQTSGTLFGFAAPSSVTLAGNLTGMSMNLRTNYATTANVGVTGANIILPDATNTGSSVYTYMGINTSFNGSGVLTQNTSSGTTTFIGFRSSNPNLVQTTGTANAYAFRAHIGTNTTGGTQVGYHINPTGGVSVGSLYGIQVDSITGGSGTENILEVGTGWDNILNSASIDISGTGAITGATGVSSTTGTFSSTLAANGGISLAASQSLTVSALSYVDLGLVVHNTTANQGLRLPNAASASPSSPTSGEGYLAWDAGGNQLIVYNGSSWGTVGGGGGYNLIKDETTGLTARTTLAFLGAGVSCADSGSQTECTINGGGSSDLQATYDADANGSNATISLTSADDSFVVSNPASAGTDSAFTMKVEQLNTGAAVDGLVIDNRGTGNSFRVDDSSGDTTPFIIDAHGRVGIGTTAISESASTERLLQVGSETNRGNSVTYGEVVTKGLKEVTALSNIKDIYVYDTTGDSDGGRWIDWATTDELSWYSETLDDGPSDDCNIATDDRCYKAAFPRKAILVVTTDALYIFDAQDNTMWMKFTQNASGYALGVDTNNDPSSVTALNGVIYVGTNGSAAGGLYAIDFVNDRMYNYDATDRSGANVGIASRNSAVTYGSDNNTNFDLGTVGTVADWARINDVSAAVIQNSTTQIAAAVTPRNGLTMVALATDSGLTLINLTDQRINQYSDATDNDYNSVVITRNAKLYGLNEALGQLEMWSDVDDDGASEVNGTPSKVFDEASTPPLTATAPTILAGAPDALEVVERMSLADAGVLATAAIASSSDIVLAGTSLGLSEVHVQQTSATAWTGWTKFTDSSKQTTLMTNSVKRMHTMDDASGDVTNAIKTDVMVPKGTPTYGINGVRGKAMSFNGTSQYLCSGAAGTCANDTSDNHSTGSWSIQMWFKHSTSIAGTDMLYNRCYTTTPAAAACTAIFMNSTGTISAVIDDDTTYTPWTANTFDQSATTVRTYNDNQWHHVVFTRTNASGIQLYVDGRITPLTGTAPTLTLDGSQIIAFGADCSVGAACGTGANFWDGAIDDVSISILGAAGTTDTISAPQARRIFNHDRPAVNRKTITVTDATTATSTTIGDSGEAWIPNEFAGMIVELTGGTGAGQTRRVVSNTATVMTVSPAFTSTPDTTTDFEVEPERLYGASNAVTAIGITSDTPLGEARMLCAGTNSGTDTGGVTCFNHQAGPNLVADVYHSDSAKTDDLSTAWTGTDYDDIQAVDFSGRALLIGSMAHVWTETEDVRLGQGMDYLTNKLVNLQNQVLNLGLQTLAGSAGIEVGFTGGADLAENYYSDEPLTAGTVVATDKNVWGGANIKKTDQEYQKNALGIVATSPGIVLGGHAENAYPVALSGRVPVLVTNENGPIYTGDRLTTSARPGYAKKAVQSGRVIGQALADTTDWVVCEGEDPESHDAILCATAFVFVNMSDYNGMPVELAMAKNPEENGLSGITEIDAAEQGLASEEASVRLASALPTKQENILKFLTDIRDRQGESPASQVFTGRVAASHDVITPTLYADTIFAKSIKADSIEGLEIFTNKIGSLDEKYKALSESVTVSGEGSVESLKTLALDKAEVKVALDVLGTLTATGGLTVGGDAEFQGETVFQKLATFFGITTFKDQVIFEKAPVFSKDTAGLAVIKKGSKKVEVRFEESYTDQPIVTVTPTNERNILLEDEVSESLANDIKTLEKDYQEAFFESNVKYLITDKHKNGFTIILNEEAPRDLIFSWAAFAVQADNISYSQEKDERSEEEPVDLEENPEISTNDPLSSDPGV